MRRALLFSLLLAVNLIAGERYETRVEHDPNGTGKFYLGREIAQVMGHRAAGWLERPEREEEEHTTALIDALKLQPGMMVADIGAGTGYITEKMARRIAPGGTAFAVDIQQEMLDLLDRKMKLLRVENVRGVLGDVSDPKLPEATIDLIILVDVYHELEFPFEMTEAMARALKPGGRLVLVEFRAEDADVPIKRVHKMSEEQVKRELAAFPALEWVETSKVLPWQHIITFRKR